MNNILTKVIIALLAILSVSNANSQPHLRLIAEGERDFKTISDAFYDYWEETGKRASDYKRFKRWEEIMLPRLDHGKLPSSNNFSAVVSEYKKIVREQGSSRIMANEWEPLGPTAWEVGANGYNPGNGRVNCITVDPVNPERIFIGAASGGVWMTSDGGDTWETTTDELAVLGITDIYINPDNTGEIIALTGDAYGNSTPSIGLIKSEDGGMSWSSMELVFDVEAFQTFFKLEVNPANRDIMYVAGNGIYRTEDAGANWEKINSQNVSDLVLHPTDPSILYAASNFESNAEEITLYKSIDGGTTWATVTNKFDGVNKSFGRKALGVTIDNPDALVVLATDANSTFGALLKSTDALETLELKSSSPNIFGYSTTGSDEDGQGGYDLAVAVSPTNEDEMYVSGVHIWKSINSGETWEVQNYWVWNDPVLPYVHADNHTLDFANGNLYAGGDGGVFVSKDNGRSFQDLSAGLAIGQFYRIGVHPTDESSVAGGLQDNGSFIRRSNDQWYHIYGADGMEALIDHTDPSIVFSEVQFGGIIRYSRDGEQIDKFISNDDGEDGGWITPYIMHPNDHDVLYFGFENVWKSVDKGDNLEKISDFRASSTISILKQHPTQPEYLLTYVDNILYMTSDEGLTWTDISSGLPGQSVTDATFGYSDPETIWVTFSNYSSSDKIYKSIDGGNSWGNQSDGLPFVPVNCVLSENSCAEGVYVGTDIGVFYKDNDLNEWIAFGNGLPNVMVRELEMQYSTNTLFAATFGRGVWTAEVDGSSPVDQVLTFTEVSDKTYGDETFGLEASVDSGRDIEFVSSDPEVIKIEGNEAEVLGAGIATITARQSGSCQFNPVFETQEVVVGKASQAIDFEPLTERREGQGEFTLVAESTSGLGVKFSSSDDQVVFVFGDKASIRGLGVATITASQDGNQNYNAADPIGQVQAIIVLGINDTEAALKIYPNPVLDGQINVVVPQSHRRANIVIYDINGQKVMSFKSGKESISQINISSLEPGVYVIQVNDVSLHFVKE